MFIDFVERKSPDFARVTQLLTESWRVNHWANSGPLWHATSEAFADFMGIGPAQALIPCSSGGVALEAMARVIDLQRGRRVRWAVSSFSFKNLNRGYFADSLILDCDAMGRLSISALERADAGSFDGIVLVNPLGFHDDVSEWTDFARRTGLPLLIDNAAGLCANPPDWDWQAFSLHHTKPFGMGEGGLALVPASAEKTFQDLIRYGDMPHRPEVWLNNGKISDLSCAFILDRLESARDWMPLYDEQRIGIMRLGREAGLIPLAGGGCRAILVTSLPFLAPGRIARDAVLAPRHFTAAKYYQPLAPTPNAESIYDRIVNIPSHPDMAKLSDDAIRKDMNRILEQAGHREYARPVVRA